MAYSLIAVFDELVKEYLAPFLKANGFKKRNLYFYKSVNEHTFLIHLQKNSYNSADYVAFFINCGIYSDEFELLVGEPVLPFPKEYECVFNQRFERITGFAQDRFDLLESSEIGKARLAKSVIGELEKVFLFYSDVKQLDGLVDICIEKGSFFYEKIFTYLCLTKDIARLETYFQSFGDTFQDDDRFLFFQNRLNRIIQSHGLEAMQFRAKMSIPIEQQRAID
jgi:Domain of unknown function (DUF4304)